MQGMAVPLIAIWELLCSGLASQFLWMGKTQLFATGFNFQVAVAPF